MNDLPDYFTVASKVIERAERGLPQDRWFRGDNEMEALVRAYISLRELNRQALLPLRPKYCNPDMA